MWRRVAFSHIAAITFPSTTDKVGLPPSFLVVMRIETAAQYSLTTGGVSPRACYRELLKRERNAKNIAEEDADGQRLVLSFTIVEPYTGVSARTIASLELIHRILKKEPMKIFHEGLESRRQLCSLLVSHLTLARVYIRMKDGDYQPPLQFGDGWQLMLPYQKLVR